MVKRYYTQDYPEYLKGNTETRTIASDFIWPSVKSSLTTLKRESRNAHGEGWWLTWTITTEAFHKLLKWTRLENNSNVNIQKINIEAFEIFLCCLCMINFFMLFLLPAWALCCWLVEVHSRMKLSIMVTDQQTARSSSTDTTTNYS